MHTQIHIERHTQTYILYRRLIAKKGIIIIQQCSIENQKGAITIDFVQQ